MSDLHHDATRTSSPGGVISHSPQLDDLPLPPVEMRQLVGGPDPELWGKARLDAIFAEVPPDAYSSVLDFGCGCGRMARYLMARHPPPRRYLGIDRHEGMIEWAGEWLAPHAPSFEFLHRDCYEHSGVGGASACMPFPVADGEVTLFIGWAVFNHLWEEDAAFHLRELGRVLAPEGYALTTWPLFDKRDFPMMLESQNTLMISRRDPTNAVIFDEAWLRRASAEAGLAMSWTKTPAIRGWHTIIHFRKASGTVVK